MDTLVLNKESLFSDEKIGVQKKRSREELSINTIKNLGTYDMKI